MIAVIQRVRAARCEVKGSVVGKIDRGLVIFVGVEEDDRGETVREVANKIVGLRIFDDEQGRMNENLDSVDGELLVVPNFTLCSGKSSGQRPSFSSAAPPDRAEELYEMLLDAFRDRTNPVRSGQFGARMNLVVENDGPVTLVRQYNS